MYSLNINCPYLGGHVMGEGNVFSKVAIGFYVAKTKKNILVNRRNGPAELYFANDCQSWSIIIAGWPTPEKRLIFHDGAKSCVRENPCSLLFFGGKVSCILKPWNAIDFHELSRRSPAEREILYVSKCQCLELRHFGIAGPWTSILDPEKMDSGQRFRPKNTQNLLLFISLWTRAL